MRPRWLDRTVAKAGPFLTLCLSEDEFKAAVRNCGVATQREWLGDGSTACVHILTNPTKAPAAIVCVRTGDGRSPVKIAASLVHEAVHVWQAHVEYIGEEKPGIEQMAYGIELIAETLMAEFARRLAHQS